MKEKSSTQQNERDSTEATSSNDNLWLELESHEALPCDANQIISRSVHYISYIWIWILSDCECVCVCAYDDRALASFFNMCRSTSSIHCHPNEMCRHISFAFPSHMPCCFFARFCCCWFSSIIHTFQFLYELLLLRCFFLSFRIELREWKSQT